jgi:AmmeMemoRadiSam system protein A
MTPENRQRLLRIARRSVEAAVRGELLPRVQEGDPELNARCGAFVTIKHHGRLRGCLGHFTSSRPLCALVNELARSSATEDPRFYDDRITPAELPEIDIEISVLSPLERIKDPLKIELGRHGIYIRRGGAAGCFLPQVATEQRWTKEQFLSYCCSHKAGLEADAWKGPDTEVLVFTTEVFGEKGEE